MNWDQISSGVIVVLATLLVLKLARNGLMRTYAAVCVFLLYQAFVSLIQLLIAPDSYLYAYYAQIYCVLMVSGWVVTLGVVFAFLKRILATVPGILRLSKTVLRIVFVGSLILGGISLGFELTTPQSLLITQVVSAVMAVERVVSTVSLFMFLGMLTFLFWFKVQMSRNVIVLNIGFILYLALRDLVYLCQVVLPSNQWRILVFVDFIMGTICYVSWLILLSPLGEKIPVQFGSNWDRSQQARIIRDLELLNATIAKRNGRSI